MDNCVALISKENKEEIFKRKALYYVTDALMVIANNTAVINKEGKIISKRFYEIENPPDINEPKETAEQIIDRIKNKINNTRVI